MTSFIAQLRPRLVAALLATALGGCATPASLSHSPSAIAGLDRIGTVDARFLSYNVEMVEVTGGRFWAPYGGPEGEVYRMRPPEDLADPRLRALARHLGPAYMRVSGTWANSTYLEAEGEHLAEPPEGYNQVLTRDQWRGAMDFARAVDALPGTSFAVSEGPRDEAGVWQTQQAQRLLDLTREAGGELAFAEFINEPNAASLGRLPANYSVADYTRDFAIFRAWAAREVPQMLIVGPGGVGESRLNDIPIANLDRILLTERLMEQSPDTVDVLSYHYYGAVSQRCAGVASVSQADRAQALSPQWIDQPLRDHAYYSALRDRFEPGDPIWITETAQAACGGSPWAASFLDTFRFVGQLGLMAQRNVQVVMHNTLAASDYALIDGDTRNPRPNYWAAVLWKRVMGTGVLAPPPSPSPTLRLYAHCLADGAPGGVGLVAINLGSGEEVLRLGGKTGDAFVMQATPLDSGAVTVNGNTPQLAADGSLSGLEGVPASGSLAIPGQSIAFVSLAGAGNRACR
jgi:hypothetical protein